MRVLVSGSMDWSVFKEQRVSTILSTVLSLHDQIDSEKFTVVYGVEDLGLAGMVDRWALRRDDEVIGERYPIDSVASNKALAVAAVSGRVDLWLVFYDGPGGAVSHTRVMSPVVPHVIRVE